MAERTTAGGTRTDRELLHAAAQGDALAYGAFKDRYIAIVFGWLRAADVAPIYRPGIADRVFRHARANSDQLGNDTLQWLAELAEEPIARAVRNDPFRSRDDDEPWTVSPVEIRRDRAARRAIEGTDADPLVRARRARERLAAIRI